VFYSKVFPVKILFLSFYLKFKSVALTSFIYFFLFYFVAAFRLRLGRQLCEADPFDAGAVESRRSPSLLPRVRPRHARDLREDGDGRILRVQHTARFHRGDRAIVFLLRIFGD
jgi:hypothetical protein